MPAATAVTSPNPKSVPGQEAAHAITARPARVRPMIPAAPRSGDAMLVIPAIAIGVSVTGLVGPGHGRAPSEGDAVVAYRDDVGAARGDGDEPSGQACNGVRIGTRQAEVRRIAAPLCPHCAVRAKGNRLRRAWATAVTDVIPPTSFGARVSSVSPRPRAPSSLLPAAKSFPRESTTKLLSPDAPFEIAPVVGIESGTGAVTGLRCLRPSCPLLFSPHPNTWPLELTAIETASPMASEVTPARFRTCTGVRPSLPPPSPRRPPSGRPQPQTVPSFLSTNVLRPPASTSVTLVIATCTGRELWFCGTYRLSPHTQTVPSLRTAAAWLKLAAMLVTLARSATRTGTSRSVCVPSPSWPALLRPHAHRCRRFAARG